MIVYCRVRHSRFVAQTVSRKEKRNPPEFPQRVRTSEGRIAWYRHEIKEHVENLKRGNAVNFRAKKEAAQTKSILGQDGK